MVIGILGAGQLARMLALAGKPLGLKFIFLDPTPVACAADVGKHHTEGTLLSLTDCCSCGGSRPGHGFNFGVGGRRMADG